MEKGDKFYLVTEYEGVASSCEEVEFIKINKKSFTVKRLSDDKNINLEKTKIGIFNLYASEKNKNGSTLNYYCFSVKVISEKIKKEVELCKKREAALNKTYYGRDHVFGNCRDKKGNLLEIEENKKEIEKLNKRNIFLFQEIERIEKWIIELNNVEEEIKAYKEGK